MAVIGRDQVALNDIIISTICAASASSSSGGDTFLDGLAIPCLLIGGTAEYSRRSQYAIQRMVTGPSLS